tara:strand:+ start:426 stop:596 length:171 start_codon:yes stop_codon:yes gene_type:complete
MHPYMKYIKSDGSLDYQKLYEEMANADTFMKKQNQEKLYNAVTEWYRSEYAGKKEK